MDQISRQRLRVLLPDWVSNYAEGSSVPQLINHLLLTMLFCNLFLFLGSLRATMLPNLGVNPLLLSVLLSCQNILTWVVLNNDRIPPGLMMRCPSLRPSDFMIGVVLGASLGGSILSFVLSLFYGRMSKCVTVVIASLHYECDHKSNMLGIWFWSGLIFWLDLGVTVLVAIGRDELTQQYSYPNSYETIGMTLDEVENNSNLSNSVNPFQQSYPMAAAAGGYSSSSGHEPLGEAQFSTQSQEQSRLQEQQVNVQRV